MMLFKCSNLSILLSTGRPLYFLRCQSTYGSYIHNVGKQPLFYKTVGDLVDEAAERYPTRNLFVACEENKKFTYQEFKEQTDKFAAGLLSIGFKRQDKLAIWGPNTLDWLISFYGAAKIGVISVLLNPYYELPEIEYCVNKTCVTGIVCPELYGSKKYYSIIKELVENQQKADKNLLQIILSSDKKPSGVHRFIDVLNTDYDQKQLDDAKEQVVSDDALCIQLSSGTTGQPKAPLLSHNNYVNTSHAVNKRLNLDSQHHRLCLQTPFFHIFATAIMLCPVFYSGSTIVVPSKLYSPLQTLKTIVSENCTLVNGTPTMFVDLIKLQKEHKFDISSLVIALTGGAPCPPIVFKDLMTYLKVKNLSSVYGLTETTGAIFQSVLNEDEFYSTETVGQLSEHMEAKVVDENGKLVPFGTPGELQVRGNYVMLEYFNDAKKTQEIRGLDNWLKTGDMFIVHRNGYGQIVGRLKDMIIRGGENIFPKEIEDFLNTHPKIVESQVFGVPDDRLGEEIMVCVRITENTNITLDEIKEFCSGKLAKFKIPKHMRIVNDFPRSGPGKILKTKLIESILKEL